MQTLLAAQSEDKRWPLRGTALPALGLFYVAGFVLALASAGPGEALRSAAAEGVLLALWLAAAHAVLGATPAESLRVRRPALELTLGALAYLAMVAAAAGRFLGLTWLRPVVGLLGLGLPLVVLLGLRYERRAWGLNRGSGQAWRALLAVIAINVAFSVLAGRLLPASEIPLRPGEDLSSGIQSAWDVLLLIGSLLIVAALPEELFFRVYLQPRLAHYLPVGWAILLQALLFSAAHLPRELIYLSHGWPVALAGVLAISNGVIGGYFWWRTRSLPILLVLHLFAYPRFGL